MSRPSCPCTFCHRVADVVVIRKADGKRIPACHFCVPENLSLPWAYRARESLEAAAAVEDEHEE